MISRDRFPVLPMLKALILTFSLLLMALAGLLFARLTWQAVAAPSSVRLPQIESQQLTDTGQLGRLAADIASRSLLGVVVVREPDPVAPTPEPRPEPARITPLTFDLVGVMASSDPAFGSAIISRSQGSPGESFRVGEDVYGQATLVEVFSRSVVLERNGQRERLEFDARRAGGTAGLAPSIVDIAGSGMASLGIHNEVTPAGELNASRGAGMRGTPAPSPGSARGPSGQTGSPLAGAVSSNGNRNSNADGSSANGNNDPMREFAENLMDQARRNPSALLSGYGISPSPEGYRIGNNARLIIMTTDLRAGDLISQINGMPVGNVDQDQARLDEFMAGGTFSITVQRGPETLQMTVRLPSLF